MARISDRKLKEIYDLMFNKLRSIQIGNKFDKLIEDRRTRTYKGKSDDWFYEKMVDCTFSAGQVRGTAIEKRKDAIRQAFLNFDVVKVASQPKEYVNKLKSNSEIRIGRRFNKVIEACVNNAKEIQKIAHQYGSFEKYVDSIFCSRGHDEQALKNAMKRFETIRGRAAILDFLKEAGIKDYIKPSRDTKRILKERLRIWTKNDDELQRIGQAISRVTGERINVVDAVIWLYSSGNKAYVKKAICSERPPPRCAECCLTKYCWHYKHIVR